MEMFTLFTLWGEQFGKYSEKKFGKRSENVWEKFKKVRKTVFRKFKNSEKVQHE